MVSKRRITLNILSTLGLALFCLFQAFGYWSDIQKANVTAKWLKVDATVVGAVVERVNCLSSRHSEHQGPSVSISYFVDDTAYKTKVTAMGPQPCGSYEWAQKEAAKYPARMKISAYVNPFNPSEATLSIAPTAWPAFLFFLVLACLALFLAFSWSSIFNSED